MATGHEAEDAIGHSKNSDNNVMSVIRLYSGLKSLLAAIDIDALKTHPAGQVLVMVEPTDKEHDIHTQLQALASCLVHAKFCIVIVKCLRPFMLDLIMRLIDPVLVLFEQVEEKWKDIECSDSMKRTAQKQQNAETLPRLRRIAQTAFQLLRVKPMELMSMWNWTSFFPLSFHDDTLSVGEEAALSATSSAVRQIELEQHCKDLTRQEEMIEVSLYQQQDERDGVESQALPFHKSLVNTIDVVVLTSNLHEQRFGLTDTSVATKVLVPTPSTKRNLRSLSIALGLKKPILVTGPDGCGKTATIREPARLSCNDDMIELHVDDQIDSKTLLGSYVCTDVPGEFTRQPGALTTAVLARRWVLIEDIDRAPFEVLAMLMPLLEMREMVLPGRDSEIEQILLTRFAKIPRQVVSSIMTTYNAVCGNTSEEISGPAQLWKETRRNYGRAFCLRDLLKWCKRIYRFCYCATRAAIDSLPSNLEYISEDERMRVVVEALDVFCAGIRESKTRLLSACALAAIWKVRPDKIKYYLEQHKPHVAFSKHEVVFGRVHLPTLSQQAQLEQATCEPALLIGETGCGKTTIVQHMAATMGQHLVVQNFNIQSDSSDLVGGYKPVEIHLLARPLYMTFVDLFTGTFLQKSNAQFLDLVRTALEQKDWKKLVKGMKKAVQMAASKIKTSLGEGGQDALESTGRKKICSTGASTRMLVSQWDTFKVELMRFERQIEQAVNFCCLSICGGCSSESIARGSLGAA
ncbi:unnamed protein product [Peronospora belbahrii]|uniref:ATPase dynein-related AAA domain-containing protein n=1 Tax=Peronospora belbahrii TaxID=622444 RepID=A0ABN8CTA2_9STRA|nr:unnamed protein product [Peronospora belbahrii]